MEPSYKTLVVDVLKSHGTLSTEEIAANLGYKKLTDTLRKAIQELLASGEASYLYPDKPNSKKQRICFLVTR